MPNLFVMTSLKPYQGMKSTLSLPTTSENAPNHPENRHSRERTLRFHSLVGKREGDQHLPMCDGALTRASEWGAWAYGTPL